MPAHNFGASRPGLNLDLEPHAVARGGQHENSMPRTPRTNPNEREYALAVYMLFEFPAWSYMNAPMITRSAIQRMK